MNKIKQLPKTYKFVATGAPLLIMVVGGPFVIKYFAEIKFKYKIDNKKLTPEEMAEYGIQMKSSKDITLESEFKKMQKLDIDNWVQVRGPRPWEENFSENEK